MGSISGGSGTPYQLNVTRETGSTTQRYAKGAEKTNTKDNFVDITDGNISLRDLEGAIDAADRGQDYALEDKIYLKGEGNKLYRIDVKECNAILDQMVNDLKSGKPIKLADIDLNVMINNRDTDLKFEFRSDDLHSWSRTPKFGEAATAIENRLRDFKMTSLQDGDSLTDQESLNLAVQAMNDANIPQNIQKTLIGKLFFGETSGVHKDHIKQIQTDKSSGDVTVSFYVAADYGDTGAINEMTFEQPETFTGVDDNMRRARIDRIKTGELSKGKDSQGNITQKAVMSEGTFVRDRKDALLDLFLLSDDGKRFAKMTPEQQKKSGEFKDAFSTYMIETQHDYGSKVKHILMENLEDQLKDPNVSNEELLDNAISIIQGLKNPNMGIVPHQELYMEDEALLEEFMQDVRDVDINIDVEDLDNIEIEGPEWKPETSPVISSKPDPTAVDLPTETKTMSLLKVWDDKFDGDKVNLTQLQMKLPSSDQKVWDAIGLPKGADGYVEKSTTPGIKIKGQDDTNPEFKEIQNVLQDWRNLEDVLFNGGDLESAKADFMNSIEQYGGDGEAAWEAFVQGHPGQAEKIENL